MHQPSTIDSIGISFWAPTISPAFELALFEAFERRGFPRVVAIEVVAHGRLRAMETWPARQGRLCRVTCSL